MWRPKERHLEPTEEKADQNTKPAIVDIKIDPKMGAGICHKSHGDASFAVTQRKSITLSRFLIVYRCSFIVAAGRLC